MKNLLQFVFILLIMSCDTSPENYYRIVFSYDTKRALNWDDKGEYFFAPSDSVAKQVGRSMFEGEIYQVEQLMNKMKLENNERIDTPIFVRAYKVYKVNRGKNDSLIIEKYKYDSTLTIRW